MKIGNIFKASGIGQVLGKKNPAADSDVSADGDASLLNHPVTEASASVYVKPSQVTGGLPYTAFEQ